MKVYAVVFFVIGVVVAGIMAAYTLKPSEPPRVIPLSEVDPSRIPNGVYLVDLSDRALKPLEVNGYYAPKEPGLYLIYFHNNDCPHCRAFHPMWSAYLSTNHEKFRGIVIIEVVCNYFHTACTNREAASTFKNWNITHSPTVLFISVSDTMKVYDVTKILAIRNMELRPENIVEVIKALT